jgi:hypothetical protein
MLAELGEALERAGTHHVAVRVHVQQRHERLVGAVGVHARLVDLLDDRYHHMRAWAAEACGKLKVRAAVPALKLLAEHDWHGGPKSAAATALERIEPKK